MDHFRTEDLGALDVLAYGLAGDGEAVLFNESVLGQFVHHRPDAPGFFHIHHVEGATRAQLGQVGGLLADFVEFFQSQVHPGFMGDGRQVEAGVGGSPHGHVHGNGVLEGFGGHDVPGPDVLFQHFHHLFPGLFGQGDPGTLVGGRDGAVARQAHAQHFRQGVHGVGGKEPGTGAAARAGAVFDGGQFLFADLPGFKPAGGFEHGADADVLSLVPAREHGAPADHHRRDVQPGSGHEHPGDDFVAVGDQHQGIKGMAVGHRFDAVRHQFPTGQGVFHPVMAHGDPVADTDGREFNGGAAVFQHTIFNGLGDPVQIHMAGNDFILGIADADERLFQFVFRISHGIEQRAVGRPGGTFFHCCTSHSIPLFPHVLAFPP